MNTQAILEWIEDNKHWSYDDQRCNVAVDPLIDILTAQENSEFNSEVSCQKGKYHANDLAHEYNKGYRDGVKAQNGESEPMCVNCQHAGQFQAFCRIKGGNVSRSWVCNKHEPIPASPKEGK